MSIANKNVEVHRPAKVTALPNGRHRVERWLRVHDAKLASRTEVTAAIFGGYGLLDGETADPGLKVEQYPGVAFADCRLVEERVESERDEATQAVVPVLYQVYETLTDTWTNEDRDQFSSTENGLLTMERTEVARRGTDPPYRTGDIGGSQIERYTATGGYEGVFTRQPHPNSGTPDTLVSEDDYILSEDNEGAGDWIIQRPDGLPPFWEKDVNDPSPAGTYTDPDGLKGPVTVSENTVILAGFENQSTDRMGRFVSRWAEAGVIEAEKEFTKDGLLYVTFQSQGTKITPTALNSEQGITDDMLIAFQGGAKAELYRDRVRRINGFRVFVITVLLKADGSVLTDGSEVSSITGWENIRYPGYVDTSYSEGIVPKSGGSVAARVTRSIILTKSGDVGQTPVPFSIKKGASVNIQFVPTATGVAESISKAYGENYLAGAVGVAGNNATFLGEPVDSVAGGGSSDPTYSTFLKISAPILSREPEEAFTTDAGEQWFRIVQRQLVGKFEDYL